MSWSLTRIITIKRIILLIYFWAFLSLYVQLPGLYYYNGLSPAVNNIERNTSFILFKYVNVNYIDTLMNIICILGCILPLIVLVNNITSNFIYHTTFACLYLLYLFMVQAGYPFMQFQWDTLLLEIGFLCIFLPNELEDVSKTMIQWILFRLMTRAGLVKLLSRDTSWFDLTALNHHWESQCIPTVLAYYVAQINNTKYNVFNQLSVYFALYIEIIIPLLLLLPFKGLQTFSANSQIFLMLLIMLTGNYNFFNILTIVLCLAAYKRRNLFNDIWFISSITLTLLMFIIQKTLIWDNNKFTLNISIDILNNFIHYMKLISIIIFSIYLLLFMVYSIVLTFKKASILYSIYITSICIILSQIFLLSSLNFSYDDNVIRQYFPSYLHSALHATQSFHITNNYGLFARMTRDRREVLIEYLPDNNNNNNHNDWQMVEFPYQPGQLDRIPPFLIPHQPRVDWQMWFAALGDYQRNPWLVHLAIKILIGQTNDISVLQLNNLPNVPPKAVRLTSYRYKFTSLAKNQKDWWEKSDAKQYLPQITIEYSSQLQSYLTNLKYQKTLNDLLNYSHKSSTSDNYNMYYLRYLLLLLLTNPLCTVVTFYMLIIYIPRKQLQNNKVKKE